MILPVWWCPECDAPTPAEEHRCRRCGYVRTLAEAIEEWRKRTIEQWRAA